MNKMKSKKSKKKNQKTKQNKQTNEKQSIEWKKILTNKGLISKIYKLLRV